MLNFPVSVCIVSALIGLMFHVKLFQPFNLHKLV